MKDIIIELKGNDQISLTKSLLDELKETFNNLLQNFRLGNSNITNQLFKKCAGYILEEYIKLLLQNISSPEYVNHFKFNDNKWYDFKYDNTPIKIITFEEDAYYSSTTLSSSQYENRKDMIFISLVYTITNDSLTISDIFVTNGKNISISYDKVLYNSVNTPIVIPDSDENGEELNALRLIFTSNLQGDIQILSI